MSAALLLPLVILAWLGAAIAAYLLWQVLAWLPVAATEYAGGVLCVLLGLRIWLVARTR